MSKSPFFTLPKNFTCCKPISHPHSAPAFTDTTSVATPTCTPVLTQLTVKFPWPRPLTGCVCYPCEFAFVVVNACITDADRYTLSGNANPATLRSFYLTQWHFIGTTYVTNSTIVSVFLYYCKACVWSKNDHCVSTWVIWFFFQKNTSSPA